MAVTSCFCLWAWSVAVPETLSHSFCCYALWWSPHTLVSSVPTQVPLKGLYMLLLGAVRCPLCKAPVQEANPLWSSRLSLVFSIAFDQTSRKVFCCVCSSVIVSCWLVAPWLYLYNCYNSPPTPPWPLQAGFQKQTLKSLPSLFLCSLNTDLLQAGAGASWPHVPW